MGFASDEGVIIVRYDYVNKFIPWFGMWSWESQGGGQLGGGGFNVVLKTRLNSLS